MQRILLLTLSLVSFVTTGHAQLTRQQRGPVAGGPVDAGPAGGPPLRAHERAPIAEEYLDVAARIVGRALVANEGMTTLETLCDDVGGRLSGSAGAERAVAWCIERMQSDGFRNVRREPVMVPHWVRGHCRVTLTAPHQADLAACALGGSIGTGGVLHGEVVAVEDFDELRELGRPAVEGKIVLFTRRMLRNGGSEAGYGATVHIRSRGAIEAGRLGAIASMIRSVGTDQARLPHTGAMFYDADVAPIPHLALAGEDADQLARLYQRGQRVDVAIDLGCETLPDVAVLNVIAEVVGREAPDEIVVIGGHLDSWDLASGAIDDGAGCVIAWEAARLLLELGLQPRRTIRVVLFMNEENGLRGAATYAANHVPTIDKHVAAIEADSGAGRPFGFSCGASDESRQANAVIAVTQIASLLRGLGADAITSGGRGGADIGRLYAGGVPCLGLRQDSTMYFDYHHTAADTVDKVDPFDLSLNIAAMAVMAYVIADLETPLGGE